MTPLSRSSLLAFGLLFTAQVTAAQDAPRSSGPDAPYVAGIGEGAARVTPDRATLTLAIQTKGATADAVVAENAQVQNRVLDTLRALGYSGDRVVTRTFPVAPQSESLARESGQVDHVGRTIVRVRITQLTEISTLVDAALGRGATNVEGIAFASSRADSARRAALTNATANARADAEAVARTNGGSLGAMLPATTGGDVFPVRIRERPVEESSLRVGDRRRSTPPVALEVHAIVLARWQFRRDP